MVRESLPHRSISGRIKGKAGPAFHAHIEEIRLHGSLAQAVRPLAPLLDQAPLDARVQSSAPVWVHSAWFESESKNPLAPSRSRMTPMCVRVRVQGAGNVKGEKPGPAQHTVVDFCPTQDLFSGDSKGDPMPPSLSPGSRA